MKLHVARGKGPNLSVTVPDNARMTYGGNVLRIWRGKEKQLAVIMYVEAWWAEDEIKVEPILPVPKPRDNTQIEYRITDPQLGLGDWKELQ